MQPLGAGAALDAGRWSGCNHYAGWTAETSCFALSVHAPQVTNVIRTHPVQEWAGTPILTSATRSPSSSTPTLPPRYAAPVRRVAVVVVASAPTPLPCVRKFVVRLLPTHAAASGPQGIRDSAA